MKVGDRVKATCSGWSTDSEFKSKVVMDKNEKGVITNIRGPYVEVLLDRGEYTTIWGHENLEVIQESLSEPQYEIY